MFPLSAGGGSQSGQGASQQQHGTGFWIGLQERRRRRRRGRHSVSGGEEGQHRPHGGPGPVHGSLQLCDPPLRPAGARRQPRSGRADQAEPGGGPDPVSNRNAGLSELHDQVRAERFPPLVTDGFSLFRNSETESKENIQR